MKKIKTVIRALAFVVAFAVLFGAVSNVLVCPNDKRIYQWVPQFYENEKNSLDAVYVGSSTAYAFWSPALAWKRDGIAVWNYTSPRQPLDAAKYIIEDCRKTQKDALYIVNINRVDSSLSKTALHYLLDYMPFSLTKLKLTHSLCGKMGLSLEKRVQYYFPLELYHSRWSELSAADFSYKADGTMGSAKYYSFLNKSLNVGELGTLGDGESESAADENEETVKSGGLGVLGELLDYCEKNKVKVLFTINPQLEKAAERRAGLEKAKQLITERGFEYVDFWENSEETGVEIPQDFYNDLHTNIHGAIKMTNILSDYLIKHYNFENKRGKKGYESWDKSVEIYGDVIAPYVLPFETEREKRDYSLSAPILTKSVFDSSKVILEWNKTENAEGYEIFRKTADGKTAFSKIAELGADALSFEDSTIQTGSEITYNYVIIAFKTENAAKIYGKFNYNGVNVAVK